MHRIVQLCCLPFIFSSCIWLSTERHSAFPIDRYHYMDNYHACNYPEHYDGEDDPGAAYRESKDIPYCADDDQLVG